MNFDPVNKFKAIVKRIDKELASQIQDLKECQKTPVRVTSDTALFSIYKRSLPVTFNLPVLINLMEEDADRAMKRLKTKQYKDADGTSHCIYYEKEQVGSIGANDVFFNPGPLTKEEPELPIIRESEAINYDYNLEEVRYHD